MVDQQALIETTRELEYGLQATLVSLVATGAVTRFGQQLDHGVWQTSASNV